MCLGNISKQKHWRGVSACVWHSLSLTVCVPAAQNVRVVQRNLVYVVGLAMDVCYEDVLQSVEHFGQFGKVVKARCPLLHEKSGHWRCLRSLRCALG